MPLDSSRLSSRVRELLRGQPGPPGTTDDSRPLDARDVPPSVSRDPVYVPDDAVTVADEAPTGCVVIERHYDLNSNHGRNPVGHYAAIVDRSIEQLAVLEADERLPLAGRQPRPGRLAWDEPPRARAGRTRSRTPIDGPLLFFDLETTGLSGGAGTVAFLVGCGYFDGDGFHTRQYFLSGYEAERDLLAALTVFAAGFAGLVTFNGRTFDVPLIDTRYLFHRLESPFETMPHFDMLPTARRLWRRRELEFEGRGGWGASSSADAASCSLGALEEAILGVQRFGDVPGMEIPSRYFHYLRTGDMTPLQAVLEHNRLDLVSLAALTATAMGLAAQGADGAVVPQEALAMGGIFERAGRLDLAEACYVRAAGLDGVWPSSSTGRLVRGEALRRLARHRRRRRRFDEAAEAWQGLLEGSHDDAVRQEARRALAIHHEHRSRDLAAARRLAEDALAEEADQAASAALRHRLARLERKLKRTKSG